MKTQQRAWLAGAVLALAVLSGCWTYSLHPLYGDDDPNLTYEPALEGTWKNAQGDVCLIITGDAKSQEYSLQLVPDDKSEADSDRQKASDSTYTGRLVQVATERFLDVVPSADGIPGVIRAHNLFKVSIEKDSLSLSPLNDDWLCSAKEGEQAALGQCIRGDFILTASIAVLQDFLRDHSDDERVFSTIDEADALHRVAKQGSAE